MSQSSVAERTPDLQALIGNRLGPYLSHNPVNRVQIWQWCSAIGDTNPLYLDRAYQRSQHLDRAVAPPTMMQVWTMRDVNMAYAPGSTDTPPYAALDKLRARGFEANVAVSYDLRFHRYLLEGDLVHHYTTVVAISELKNTSLGQGHFVTERVEYLDQHAAMFAQALITYFQYRPDTGHHKANGTGKASGRDGAQSRPPSATGAATGVGLAAATLRAGDSLPELAIPITHKLIVSGALASQDFIDVHHNANAARAAAMPDIFMNILTSCGLCGRYLGDWGGPASRLKSLKMKLLAPNLPGDLMLLHGKIARISRQDDQNLVAVDFAGTNNLGLHLRASAEVALAGCSPGIDC
jgi:acyl dehydratase